jgi:branched-subunit amino acid aminotransferase/4-amino-4-deoxychorismate lyase
MICNHNGRFINPEELLVSGQDGAWLFGDTLFETMKATGGHIHFLRQHLDRIEASAGLIDFPFERAKITEALDAAMQQAGKEIYRIRLTISRGAFSSIELPPTENGHFLVQIAPATEPSDDERSEGIVCVLAPNRRVNPLSHFPQMKRGNYVDCLYAANFARSRGAREALFVSKQGLLLEGATSNIFLIKDETLITPTLGELVLRGIIRGQVLELAGEWGMRIESREIAMDELFSADEVFITNSLIDVLPVAEIDGRSINKGPLTQKFLAGLRNEENAT